ncbi:MAG: translation initiation factor IF-3 [bacterium JZ-2024 1]
MSQQTPNLVNEAIRAREMLVIDPKGKNLGVMSREAALKMAEELGLDLVLVAMKTPPVCRLMNYEKYLYQMEKKQREAEATQRRSEPKEVKFGIRIGPKDLETKLHKIREFLMDGRKVRVVVWFKGWRELVHADQGRVLLQETQKKLEDLSRVEVDIRQDGRKMYMIVSPKKEAGSNGKGKSKNA